MNLGIEGKTALVTGGVHGIGKAIADGLREEGCNVLVTSTASEGIRVDFTQTDWQEGMREALDGVKVDILVNNAGHTLNITDPYCSLAQWDLVLNLNFLAAVEMSNIVIPGMKKRDFGRIVNITSIAGIENSGPATFCCAKAALTTYTHCVGRILATESRNVVMSAVFPGVVITEGGHWDRKLKADPEHARRYLAERCPIGRFGTVKEIADVVVFQCSQLASFSHGAIIGVDGGQSKGYMQGYA
jgi:3-oxoacyl-[acyl-carrier protein] reductase